MMFYNKETGFTLIEVLTSIVIIVVVSLGAYFTFFGLAGANRMSLNRLTAIGLTQAALEEVRSVARYNFDGLTKVSFADNIDQAKHPGFHRAIVVTAEGSLELKRVSCAISWTENNKLKRYNIVTFIARMPEPLPANIKGSVKNKITGLPAAGAKLTVTYIANTTLTFSTTTDSAGNYNFRDTAGNPRLKPGDWTLTLTNNPGYNNLTVRVEKLGVDVTAEDRVVNIDLNPKPEPATIHCSVIEVDKTNKLIGPIAGDGARSLSLWEKGQLSKLYDLNGWGMPNPKMLDSNGIAEFKIYFNDSTPRIFSVVTANAYGQSSFFSSGYCGNFPDTDGLGKDYNYKGWSSSVVMEDGSFVLTNPWLGSGATDRINVNPGETITMEIPLTTVPKTKLKIHVVDSNGNTVPNATLRLTSGSYNLPPVTIKEEEKEEIEVPDSEELSTGPLTGTISAWTQVPGGACGQPEMQLITSAIPGNIDLSGGPSSVTVKNFTLPQPVVKKYGNLEGYVKDGVTGNGIPGVSVQLYPIATTLTDENGRYSFSCTPEQTAQGLYRVPIASWYELFVSKNGYYLFNNYRNSLTGWVAYPYSINTYYMKTAVVENKTTVCDDIWLWPCGYGTIEGRVVIFGAKSPIAGAIVKLSMGPYAPTYTTGADGKFSFINMPESWPPPSLPNDPAKYNLTPILYYLAVAYTDAYVSRSIQDIQLPAGQSVDLGDIELSLKAQL